MEKFDQVMDCHAVTIKNTAVCMYVCVCACSIMPRPSRMCEK